VESSVSSSRRSLARFAPLALLALLAFGPGAQAASNQPLASGISTHPLTVPASGFLELGSVRARAQASPGARVVATVKQFEADYRLRVILALDVEVGAKGKPTWYKISLPGRPNGRTGWIPASAVSLTPVYKEIVIHRGSRTLELYDHEKLVMRTKVAVGAPGMETPLGTYFVVWGFHPPDPFLGVWAFATSAYSRLSEWPGGGIVGIHGTSAPQFLGQAVSHGCVRVSNSAVTVLKGSVRPGTPIRILRD
jgi:lipoprotein-anchoring transpeptidase ErfK/SrfK